MKIELFPQGTYTAENFGFDSLKPLLDRHKNFLVFFFSLKCYKQSKRGVWRPRIQIQISLIPTCFYCSTELQFFTVAGMLSCDTLPMDIGEKYFDGNSCLLQKAPQVFGRKLITLVILKKVYGMRTIITIVKADYCLMSQLL